MTRRARLAVLLLAVLAVSAQALPVLKAPVNDFAGVIDAQSAAALDQRIRALEAATKDAVVVVTVKTIAPYATIEEYAVKLFEEAKVGQRRLDNGVLIVLAQQERRVRIEVGYGLEEFVTDGFAGEVIRQQMLPAFRDGRFGEGLLAGATRVIDRIATRRGIAPLTPQPPRENSRPHESPLAGIAVGIIVVLIIILARIKGRMGGPRRRRRWGPWSGWTGGTGGFGGGVFGGGFGGGGFGGGGGGGGSFGGFGGGRSGGGGASGGW